MLMLPQQIKKTQLLKARYIFSVVQVVNRPRAEVAQLLRPYGKQSEEAADCGVAKRESEACWWIGDS